MQNRANPGYLRRLSKIRLLCPPRAMYPFATRRAEFATPMRSTLRATPPPLGRRTRWCRRACLEQKIAPLWNGPSPAFCRQQQRARSTAPAFIFLLPRRRINGAASRCCCRCCAREPLCCRGATRTTALASPIPDVASPRVDALSRRIFYLGRRSGGRGASTGCYA